MQAFAYVNVIKGVFNHRLTGIKVTLNGNGMNIIAQGGKQLLLQWADLAFGKQDNHVDVIQPVEGMGNRSTGVTGGCSQNGNRCAVTDASQALGHKPAAKVFKGQCWAVEQFQAVGFIIHLLHFGRKSKRVFYDIGNSVFT